MSVSGAESSHAINCFAPARSILMLVKRLTSLVAKTAQTTTGLPHWTTPNAALGGAGNSCAAGGAATSTSAFAAIIDPMVKAKRIRVIRLIDTPGIGSRHIAQFVRQGNYLSMDSGLDPSWSENQPAYAAAS